MNIDLISIDGLELSGLNILVGLCNSSMTCLSRIRLFAVSFLALSRDSVREASLSRLCSSSVNTSSTVLKVFDVPLDFMDLLGMTVVFSCVKSNIVASTHTIAVSMSKWHENLTHDPGWNTSAFDGSEELTPARNKILKKKLIDRNLVCASGGNIYVFLTTINCWSIICSKETMAYVNSLMGMESASVSLEKAFHAYVNFVERHAIDNVAKLIPLSICVGTTRLRVSRDSNSLLLTKCESLIPSLPTPAYDIPSRLCYASVATRHWPSKWVRTDSFPLYKFLSPLFTDAQDMKTVEWIIGNALIDPHAFSKAVVLYGEGGRGKGTFLGALTIALMGCCGTIPDGALVSASRSMPVEIASTVVSNRMITAGDVGSVKDTTNFAMIKTITGHDFIPVPPTRARSACTLFYACNRLDDPTIDTEWATEAMMRRVVVINMTAYFPEGIEASVPQDPTSRLDFALRCVHTKLSYQNMPVSPYTVVTTVLGSKIEEASQYLAPIGDDEADEDEIIAASNIVAGYASIPTYKVGQLAYKISHDAVCTIRSVMYIKGIVPSSNYKY